MFPIKDSIRIPTAPVVTYFIILINTVVFLYQYALTPRQSYYFSMLHALVPRRYFDASWAAGAGLSQADYWPFITSVFMHGGWWHLIINMWTLFIFGSSLEGRLGRLQYLSFYLVCGVIASFTHAYFNQESNIPVVGASGAIAGVMGAYATTFPRARITILVPIVIIPLFFKVPALGYAIIWFALQFLQGFMELFSAAIGGGIAWWAHIGGFLAGVVLIPLWRFGPDMTYDENAVRAQKRDISVLDAVRPGGAGIEAGKKENPSPWRRGPWG